jgi:hypothetical protein
MAKKKAVRRTTKKTTRTAGRKKAARPAARKAAKKTAARRTTTAAAKPGKISAAKKPRTKSEIYGLISEQVGITKKDVAAVFDTVSEIAKADLSKRGPGQLNLGA